MVKRVIRTLLLFVGPCLLLSACAGSSLHVRGDLTRPARAAGIAPGAPQAVVADFSYAGGSGGAIGRDFDRVRTILWNGDPGKGMADLVAAVLAERGVATVRRGTDAPGAPGAEAVPVRISGVVRRFEMNTRRTGNFVLVTEATVTLSIAAEGPGLPRPAERTVTSSTSLSNLFVTSDDLRDALVSTANAVAEEAARILLEAKAVAPSS